MFWGSVHLFQHASELSSTQSPLSLHQTTNKEEAEAWRTSNKRPAGLSRSSNLHRAGSVKNLISKFSGPDQVSSSGSPQSPSSALESLKSKSSPSTPSSVGQDESPVPSITVTPPFRGTGQNEAESAQRDSKSSQITARIDCPVGGSAEKTDSEPKRTTQTTDSGRASVADSGMGSVSKKNNNS